MKRPKEPARTPAEWLRVYVWRADTMIAAALDVPSGAARGGSRSKLATACATSGLRKAAAEVMRGIDAIEAGGDADTLTLMHQYGMLRHIADGWRLRRVQPMLWRYAEAGERIRTNRASANARRRGDADTRLIERFAAWQRRARNVLAELPARSRAEKFAKYSLHPPRSTARRRLYALAAAGRLPEL